MALYRHRNFWNKKNNFFFDQMMIGIINFRTMKKIFFFIQQHSSGDHHHHYVSMCGQRVYFLVIVVVVVVPFSLSESLYTHILIISHFSINNIRFMFVCVCVFDDYYSRIINLGYFHDDYIDIVVNIDHYGPSFWYIEYVCMCNVQTIFIIIII